MTAASIASAAYQPEEDDDASDVSEASADDLGDDEPEADGDAAADEAAPATEAPAAAPAKEATPAAAPAEPWYKRHRPTRNQIEIGVFGGILLPAKDHELYNPATPWQPYKRVAPDFGVRVGYYPLRVLGLEIEGGLAPTKVTTDNSRALLGTFRGYGLVQLPYRLAPFALFGIGLMGTTGLGKDVDPALHYGGGVKFYVNDLIALRLDARDNLTRQMGIAAGRTHNVEILLGVSIVLNRQKPKEDPDTDGDGFKDKVDACPTVPGVAPDGCPPPDPDTDGDGFKDKVDACPTEPGVAPDGCPIPDRDGDGIPDPDDQCPDDPETKNNYLDQDGCPDEIPKEVKKFTGVIEGIFFDTDKDTITPQSRPVLDRAKAVLDEYPEVKVEISGHTDTDGDRDHNIDLSRRRAEAVRRYLVDAGIDESRITTRGAGPDEPLGSNDTEAGKAKNRRIEFNLIQ
ncbi:MAG: OmpA family protein [Myxococcales bacterium]|nr:OmpA family protein [Myxococcales bacterium]